MQVTPEEFRAEMIGPQKALSPDGGADLGALRHRTLKHFAQVAGVLGWLVGSWGVAGAWGGACLCLCPCLRMQRVRYRVTSPRVFDQRIGWVLRMQARAMHDTHEILAHTLHGKYCMCTYTCTIRARMHT